MMKIMKKDKINVNMNIRENQQVYITIIILSLF